MSQHSAELLGQFPPTLLSRVEDAGLNASAPPQQRWLDGWLVRLSPGKAKRARCVNAVAEGRLPLADRLALARASFREASLPFIVRITPFTQPASLEATLVAAGMHPLDDTRVMLHPQLSALAEQPLPPDCHVRPLDADAFAETVGGLRGSPASQRQAHAQRLAWSPVPYRGFALQREGEVLACGQIALEADLVGLYDVFTDPRHRGQGWAQRLCRELLLMGRAAGARSAYLQVEHDNHPARAAYRRLGFSDGYSYHYRTDDPSAH